MLNDIIQGSVIGPLLFLIFLNDLVELLASAGISVKVFADDMKIYIRGTSNIDVRRLQTALDLITQWAQAWQLQDSVDKCYVLNLGTHVCDQFERLNISSNALVPTCRDLGVNVTSDLVPSVHIDRIIVKAHQRVNNILRCFVSHDRLSLTKAFVTYVWPLLEYNSVMWTPYLKYDIQRVEQVKGALLSACKAYEITHMLTP